MLKRYWQLGVKATTWRLEWVSYLRPSGHKALNLLLSHHAPQQQQLVGFGCSKNNCKQDSYTAVVVNFKTSFSLSRMREQ